MTADSCVELDKPYLLSHPAETLRFAHIGPIKYQVLSYINMVPSFDFIAYKRSGTFLPKTINHQSSLGTFARDS